MILRDYQTELISKIYQSWERGNRTVIAQLPTGGGKTIIISALVQDAIERDLKCLILAHREELINQAVEKVEAITNEPVGVIKSGIKAQYDRAVQVASVQSMKSRLDICPEFDLIIIDEAHHSTSKSYTTVLDRYPNARVLGVTATPIRLDGKGFRGIFDDLVTGISVTELIGKGNLSPYHYYGAARTMTVEGLSKRGGDYKAEAIAESNPIELVGNQVVESYTRHLNGKQAIVFAVSCEQSEAIAQYLRAAGIEAHHLDGTTESAERRSVMDLFRQGEIKVLTNCALFDEGLDIPSLDGAILARPTASLSRYLQMVGRALRPHADKDHAVIIDIAGNYSRHGMPDDARVWSLDGIEKKQKERKSYERNPATDRVEVVVKLVDTNTEYVRINGKPVQMTEELQYWITKIDKLTETAAARGYKAAWVTYQLMEAATKKYMPAEAWKYAGSKLGYHHKWADHKLDEMADKQAV